MDIIYEGVRLELTEEQVKKFEDENRVLSSPDDIFNRLVISQIDLTRPRCDFRKYPSDFFWFDTKGNLVMRYNELANSVEFDRELVWEGLGRLLVWEEDQVSEFLKDTIYRYFNFPIGTIIARSNSYMTKEIETYFRIR